MPFDQSPRLRGSAGVKQRKRRLAAEPLCRVCREKGRTTIATQVDHIIPLAFGGPDAEDNVQSLCDDCHAFKSAHEAAGTQGAATHPAWLERSAIPLTIVCGPPCAGKTTYVREQASPSHIIIDLDEIAREIDSSYRPWSGLNPAMLDKAIRARNAMLGGLRRMARGKAWFIVSAPTEAERQWWQGKLGGEVVLLDPGQKECERRAIARGTPKAAAGIIDWYRKAKGSWLPPSDRPAKVIIGEDGWPVE